MAKQMQMTTSKKDERYPFPSRFGSHQSMVDANATAELQKTFRKEITFDQQIQGIVEFPNTDLAVCKDERGFYVTQVNRLNDRTSDTNRYNSQNARDMEYWGLNLTQPAPVEAETVK